MKSFLPGFWLAFLAASIRHPKIQNKTQKHKQQPPLCSVSLPHLHVPPTPKRARYQPIPSPWIFKWHSKTPAFLPGKRYRVDWHYIEFTRVSDHTVTKRHVAKKKRHLIPSHWLQKSYTTPLSTNSHAPKHWYSSIIIIVSFFVTMKKHLIFWTFRTSVFFALLTKVIY